MARSVRPLRFVVAVPVVAVISLSLTGCVADPPPLIGAAIPGNAQAVVSWQPPLAAPSPITAYVVTPWIGFTRQTPTVFNSAATTETVTGLTNGVTYTFTVHAVNAHGDDSAESGMSNPVTPGPQIAAGGAHSCAIVAGGSVDCWGQGFFGQLGNGTTADSHTAVPVTGLSGATAIAAGGGHSCAIVAGGAVDCWGYNGSGALGDGTTTDSSIPVAVTGLTGVTAIAAGSSHTCAVVAGGAVQCWGYNDQGQLGNGTRTSSSTPVAVTGLTGAVAVGTGSSHTCASLTDGTVKCWGDNSSGQLGNSVCCRSLVPAVVAGITGATAVSAGGGHSCALVTAGTAMCWGANSVGQLGVGYFSGSINVPQAVAGLSGATAITALRGHTCAPLVDGSAKCWGGNGRGQLGIGTLPTCDPEDPSCHLGSAVPVTVVGLTQLTAVASGVEHTCALVAGGAAYCWGGNSYGQLGNGTMTGSPTPVAVIWP